jgi:hypothetical protein
LDLLPDCDRFPVYSNSTINPALERYCFRGSFLDDVKAELGDERYARAWTLMTAAELFTYGKEIAAIAKRYSANNNLAAIANTREAPDDDDGTPASKAHILASAARWCVYWAERGHGLEPDF